MVYVVFVTITLLLYRGGLVLGAMSAVHFLLGVVFGGVGRCSEQSSTQERKQANDQARMRARNSRHDGECHRDANQ